jgi:hypothetical protein
MKGGDGVRVWFVDLMVGNAVADFLVELKLVYYLAVSLRCA